MKAMILAAGFGSRLRPLTDTTPKPLLPLAGRPLVEWNLHLLRRYGVIEVIINLHHLGDQIERALGDGSRFGMRFTYSHEPVILGTGGSIKQAESFFGGESFLVVNGDTVLELDVGALWEFHARHGALATMVVREDPEAKRWGAVEVDDAHRVLRINGRGRGNDTGVSTVALMFAGVHVMRPRLLQDIPVGRESSIIDAYVDSIRRGEVVLGYRMQGYWSDVGTLARYHQTQRDVEQGCLTLHAYGGGSDARDVGESEGS